MNYRAEYLPDHWKDWVNGHPDLSKGMLTPAFNRTVNLLFEDGSHAFFNYAFIVEDDEHNEIAVFTEHCGYYVFSRRGLKYYNSSKTDNFKKENYGN